MQPNEVPQATHNGEESSADQSIDRRLALGRLAGRPADVRRTGSALGAQQSVEAHGVANSKRPCHRKFFVSPPKRSYRQI